LLINCINTIVLAEQSLHHNIIVEKLDHCWVNRICTKIVELNDENFRNEIDKFPNYDSEDNEQQCRVELFIDHKERELTISFGDSFAWSQLDNGEGRLDFLIIFDKNNTEPDIYTVLEYACYDQNECDKLFVFNHIYWFKQMNYTLFQTNLKSLLYKNINHTG